MAETVSTATQVVTVRTRRGNLRIGPHGRIDGLWRIIERELRTGEQVRIMCAGHGRRGRPSTKPIERRTFSNWRSRADFPRPVVKLAGVDFWSRTDVEDWLRQREF